MNQDRTFAGFDSSFEKADYVLVGIPYDKTSSFQTGSYKGPEEIRKSSYCFEPYLMEYGISLDQVSLHDFGDLDEYEDYDELCMDIRETLSRIVNEDKFPILLGGEHSISPPIVSTINKIFSGLTVIVLDAHLDFRDTYEGIKHSHATASKRISEIVGIENVIVGGVRSISDENAEVEKPVFLTSREIKEQKSIEKILPEKDEPIYLSIDMDIIDPSYAPGVGNPEPFGLSSLEMKDIVSQISKNLVGTDIVETNPKYDCSNITANLGARLVYELIGSREKKR